MRNDSPKLVTLDIWAARVYGDGAPGIDTLRRWAREARINPQPEKHGRAYMVRPDARYAPDTRRPRLVDRIKHGSQKRA